MTHSAKDIESLAPASQLQSAAAPPITSDAPPATPKQLPVRYDGRAKVMGTAKFAAEFKPPIDPAYAFLVQSTIPSGQLLSIDQSVAERSAGVLAVITPFNAPKLPAAPPQPPARTAYYRLSGKRYLL